MSLKRKMLNELLGVSGHLLSLPAEGHRALMYHQIDAQSRDPFSLSPSLFTEHLEIIEAHKIPVVEFGARPAGFSLSLTFDDGFADNLTVAAPLLARSGWPFTVFVTPKFVRESTPGYLSVAQLKELALVPGATVGAHGNTHARLGDLSLAEAEQEMRFSKSYLEDVLQKEISSMSFPNGSCNQELVNLAQGLGFRRLGTSQMSLNKGLSALVARTVIMRDESASMLLGKIKGTWDWHGKYRSVYSY